MMKKEKKTGMKSKQEEEDQSRQFDLNNLPQPYLYPADMKVKP
jgi:hypothetical protein